MQGLRTSLLAKQPRAFSEGKVEWINGEWIFFDLETEEAYPLEAFESKEVYIFRQKSWKKGILSENGMIRRNQESIQIQPNDFIKIRKQLHYAFELLLEDFHDAIFFRFIQQLNKHDFSIYDVIFCHNHLTFLPTMPKQGVNMMVFDNGRHILSVLHHFFYDKGRQDRFEFTTNTGERFLYQYTMPPEIAH